MKCVRTLVVDVLIYKMINSIVDLLFFCLVIRVEGSKLLLVTWGLSLWFVIVVAVDFWMTMSVMSLCVMIVVSTSMGGSTSWSYWRYWKVQGVFGVKLFIGTWSPCCWSVVS